MKKYRIIQNPGGYRIQRKWGWFGWWTVGLYAGTNYIKTFSEAEEILAHIKSWDVPEKIVYSE